MNLQGFIKTEHGALIMVEYRGYGRSSVFTDPAYKYRQVIGAAWHLTDSEKYGWPNEVVCAISGEVRTPATIPKEEIRQADVKLVFSVSEMIWEKSPE